MKLVVGISPCPNDVWAFAGLLLGKVRAHGLDLAFELHDVQELNAALAAGRYDLAKTSFLAALQRAGEFVVLRSGSALGFGVGPVLVANAAAPAIQRAHVLLPGANTTANLLFRLHCPQPARVEHVVFSDILPRIAAGGADMGVCIHEGRFVYPRLGLRLVEDLGARWEESTGSPLPLGGIVARRTLDPQAVAEVDAALARSLAWARDHAHAALELCRRHAQELEESVLRAHIELYVNERTHDLGEVGRRALAELGLRARQAGLVAHDAPELLVR